MTIAAYTGLPGHGKSYGVVENVIVPALKAKREVYTNIPMNRDECLKRFEMEVIQFDIQEIIDNSNWWTEVFKPGAVIIIDELWRLWPSGLKANNVRDEDKSFLAEHRHMVGENGHSVEIVFVTQDLSQVASFARALVENTFRVTKLSKLGLDKRYRVDVYFGSVTGPSPPISKREREIHGEFKKDTYELYKSHTKSVTGSVGNETRIDKRFRALGGLSIKIGLLAIVLALVGFSFGLKHLSQYYTGDQSSATSLEPAPGNIAPVPSQTSIQKKESVLKFLSRAESIFITGEITIIKDGAKRTEFNFGIEFDNSHVDLTQFDLHKLGYEVSYINQCMFLVKGPDYNGYALCASQDKGQGWVENLVTQGPTAM
jgi:zona occludens toxin